MANLFTRLLARFGLIDVVLRLPLDIGILRRLPLPSSLIVPLRTRRRAEGGDITVEHEAIVQLTLAGAGALAIKRSQRGLTDRKVFGRYLYEDEARKTNSLQDWRERYRRL